MLYCIEINRGGIGEENVVIHHQFKAEPTSEEVLNIIMGEDMGYDDMYCKFNYYKVG